MRRGIAAITLGVALLVFLAAQGPTAAEGGTPKLVISEVACCPESDSAADEWVELRNLGGAAVPLDGWSLTVGTQSFALAGEVPAGGYFVIAASSSFTSRYSACGSNVMLGTGRLGSALGDGGSRLSLLYRRPDSGETTLADAMSYGSDATTCLALAAPRTGMTLHRLGLGGGQSCDYVEGEASPCGGPPPAATATPTPTPLPQPTATAAAAAVLIAEVNYQGDCSREWAELYNPGPTDVALTGWRLRDNTLASLLDLVLGPGQTAVIGGSAGSVGLACPALSVTTSGACVGNGLADGGDSLSLEDATGRVIDAMAYGEAIGPAGLAAPDGQSLARFREEDGSLAPWSASDLAPGCLQSAPALPTPTPVAPQEQAQYAAYLPAAWQRGGLRPQPSLLISEVLYDAVSDDGEEFVEVRNYTAAALSLAGMLLGDAERPGDGEAMYVFPTGAEVAAGDAAVVARCAAGFKARFGVAPDFEFRSGTCPDSPAVPDLARAAGWGSSPFGLADDGDEVLLLGASGVLLDSVAYRGADYAAAGLEGYAAAAQPLSLQRVAGLDANDMSLDFAYEAPSPGAGLDLPAPPLTAPASPAWAGAYCFWGNLHAHTSASDGSGPAELAFARARAAGMHFYAVTDHDHWLRPVEWRNSVAAAGDATSPGAFVALAGVEWSSPTEGHVNVIGGYELVSHEDPATADLAGLYRWLAARPGVIAQFNHPGLGSGFGGQADAGPAPVVRLQEVGNGGSGRHPDLYESALLTAWRHGWPVAPTIGSDTEGTDWGTDLTARTGVWAAGLDAASLMVALAEGRAFATEDADLALAWRCDATWMGSHLPAGSEGACTAYYVDGQAEGATIAATDFDGAVLVQWLATSGGERAFAWPPGAAALWLKATQPDGDLAWSAPIWR